MTRSLAILSDTCDGGGFAVCHCKRCGEVFRYHCDNNWRRSVNRHGVGRIWRDASRLERNLESEPSNYNGVPV